MVLPSLPERYNASLLIDRNLEKGRGDRIAILWEDERISYQALFDRVCRTAKALAALGVGPEDRVLMVLDDRPAFPALFLGAIRLGAVPVPVNPLYDPEDYRYFVEDSEARFMVVDPARAQKVREGLGDPAPSLKLMTTGDEVEGIENLDTWVEAESGELSPADTHRDDMAFWLYSSGSTGRPKGVVHLQHDILFTCETYARHVLGITQDDITFSSTKLFHAYGLGNNMSFPYWAGATTALLSGRPAPQALFDTIEARRPTLFFCVPTLYNAMLNLEEAGTRDLSSVRACISAAEPLPPEVWNRWRREFGLTILDGIGSTEMLHIYCSNTLEDAVPGSSGRPVPGYEMRVLAENGDRVADGEAGNLWVRGDSCFDRYWNKPEKTEASLEEGWFFSGDRYRRDADGYFHYEGRADDMFKVSGLWVSPIEVENALMEHPAVAEAAVVAAQAEGFTHAKAFVVARDPSAAGDSLKQELYAFCEGKLHRYEQPRFIELVEDLPHTLTGKVQRYKLREGQANAGPRVDV